MTGTVLCVGPDEGNRSEAASALREAARLAALERYAPDPAGLQASFDRLTAIVSDLLTVPVAGIGLLDAHDQEFVACRGVQFGSVPREDTVCTEAILDDEVTTIADAETDSRFAASGELTERGLRAYASANVTVDGEPVGTLCVYDDAVREWSDRDRERLRLVAETVGEHLELRRQARVAGADGRAEPAPASDAAPDASSD